jgi:hypothetical protein
MMQGRLARPSTQWTGLRTAPQLGRESVTICISSGDNSSSPLPSLHAPNSGCVSAKCFSVKKKKKKSR